MTPYDRCFIVSMVGCLIAGTAPDNPRIWTGAFVATLGLIVGVIVGVSP